MNFNDIPSLVSNCEWENLSKLFKDLTCHFRTDKHRTNVDQCIFQNTFHALALARETMESDSKGGHPFNTQLINCVTDIFRCLRNASAGSKENQTVIFSSNSVPPDTLAVLCFCVEHGDSPDFVTLQKCLLQFLGNVCVGHLENQKLISSLFGNIFSKLIESPELDVINFTSMILHNCLLSCCGETKGRQLPHHLTWDSPTWFEVWMKVVKVTVQKDLEWGLYVVEDLLQTKDFCKMYFKCLQSNERLFLIEVMISMLKRTEGSEEEREACVCVGNLEFLAEIFKSDSLSILRAGLADTQESEVAMLLVKTIEALGTAMSMNSVYSSLQDDSELLCCSLNLLRGIRDIGNQGDNPFTSVEKVWQGDEHVDQEHPVYGVKRDLIRLLANMLYRHQTNQNLVREHDGIPLILNMSNIDRRNPYITQWVVLAIRNLCEGNEDNKQFLASMRLEGLASNVETLREFGVKAELCGDKIIVKPPDDHSEDDSAER